MNDIKNMSINRTLLIIGIIFIAFNMRPAITSIGPLLGIIRDDIGLSNLGVGMVTSLPLFAFAAMSLITPKVSSKLGNMHTVLYGLLILIIGIVIRSISGLVLLFIGSVLIGVGIAILNVLLPAVVKEKFPERIGMVTSIYSTTMVVFAALASGVSVPLAQEFGLGWQLSLLSWSVLAVAGFIVWFWVIKKDRPLMGKSNLFQSGGKTLWRSSLAWQVTLFMGLQSLLYYVLVSWLPQILQDFGFSVSASGWLLSYFQFVSLPFTFIAPILAERFKNQQGIVLVIGILCFVGFCGLLYGGPLPLIILWITIIGIGLGGTISLALALFAMRTENAVQAAELSGMAQFVGYLLAAIGPFGVGYLYDFFGNWVMMLVLMIVVTVMMTISGFGAGRNKTI